MGDWGEWRKKTNAEMGWEKGRLGDGKWGI